MECEVRKIGEGDGHCERLVRVAEEEVQTATDLLLHTNFSACLDTCRHVIACIKASEHCDPHVVDKLDKVQEAATVIAIQALAEQGTWREVIPFVEQVYTHMAACPAAIMQMCLLLHAHMREYMVCHSLLDSWLDWADHRHRPESGPIVATYVSSVLLPLRAYNLIPQVVERCTVLSSEERQELLSPRVPISPQPHTNQVCRHPSATRRLALDSSDGIHSSSGSCSLQEESAAAVVAESDPLQRCADDEEGGKHRGLRIVSLYMRVARRLLRRLASKGWCQQLRSASKLFLLISFLLLALLHVQTDVTANFGRAMELWRGAVGALHSMWERPSRKLR